MKEWVRFLMISLVLMLALSFWVQVGWAGVDKVTIEAVTPEKDWFNASELPGTISVTYSWSGTDITGAVLSLGNLPPPFGSDSVDKHKQVVLTANSGTRTDTLIVPAYLPDGRWNVFVIIFSKSSPTALIAQAFQAVWVDKTPPVIIPFRYPLPNAAGWNNTDVNIRFFCSDISISAASGMASCPDPVTLTSEGENQAISVKARDIAGNTQSLTVENINIDKTPPQVRGQLIPDPGKNGWYNVDVAANFVCNDSLSGIASCGPDQIISTEGQDQSVLGLATDRAGNTANFVIQNINIDKTPPTITANYTPSPNAHGWHNTDVQVEFVCEDALSGLSQCSPPVTVSTEGANQIVEGLGVDQAGNSGKFVATVNIDKTEPTIIVNSPEDRAAYRLYNRILADWSVEDSLSGIAIETVCSTTPNGSLIDTLSLGLKEFTITVSDKAGNSATKVIHYEVLRPIVPFSAPPPLVVEGVRTSLRWGQSSIVDFIVQGTGISGMQVEVFDLRGRKLFASGLVPSDKLAWHMQDSSGLLRANGVYLYVITVYGFDGKTFRSQVQKLVILK